MGDKAKRRVLHDNGTLNPHPEGVSDPLFQVNPFFDADDLLQVKYEMLRRVHADAWPVARSAATFGFSRITYYKADKAFREEGLDGLVPRKRGPKGGHKLTEEVLACARAARAETPDLPIAELLERLVEQFGVRVHRRTLERALHATKKKRRPPSGKSGRVQRRPSSNTSG